MRKFSLIAAVLMAASPLPALAQDVLDDEAYDKRTEEKLGNLAGKLSDPETQDRFAGMIAAIGTVLLDLPVAPLAQAAAEMAGEDVDDIDPDMTLRDMAPEAQDVTDEAARKLPRMMGAMAGMAGGLEAMLPALREMVIRMDEVTSDLR